MSFKFKNGLSAMMAALMMGIGGFANVSEAANIKDHPRVSVMEFGNKAITSRGLRDTDFASASEYAIYQLSACDWFDLIDYEQLSNIAQMHNINMSGFVDQSSAVQLGKIASAQFMVIGNVTGLTTKENRAALQAANAKAGNAQHVVTANVTMRIVDIETGRIVVSGMGSGSSTSTSTELSYTKFRTVETLKNKLVNTKSSVLEQTATAARDIANTVTSKDSDSRTINNNQNDTYNRTDNRNINDNTSATGSGNSSYDWKNGGSSLKTTGGPAEGTVTGKNQNQNWNMKVYNNNAEYNMYSNGGDGSSQYQNKAESNRNYNDVSNTNAAQTHNGQFTNNGSAAHEASNNVNDTMTNSLNGSRNDTNERKSYTYEKQETNYSIMIGTVEVSDVQVRNAISKAVRDAIYGKMGIMTTLNNGKPLKIKTGF